MNWPQLFNGRNDVPDLRRSRAVQYGDGVFRTCLVDNFQVLDLEEHLQKLSSDANAIGLAPPSPAILRREATSLASTHRRAVLKIMLFRSGGGRGYAPATTKSERLLQLSEAPVYPARHWQRGIVAERSPFRLASPSRLAGIKHLNRLEQVLALRDAPSDTPELLVCDGQGRPLSGVRSNLFWVRRGRLYTPRLDQCGVAGVMRKRILDASLRSAISASQVRGSWKLLLEADEAFVCNSLVGIWPLHRIGSRQWTAPGPVTRILTAELSHPRLDRK